MSFAPVSYRIVPTGGSARDLAMRVLRNAGARGRGDRWTIAKERTGVPSRGVTPHQLYKQGVIDQIVNGTVQATTR